MTKKMLGKYTHFFDLYKTLSILQAFHHFANIK